MKNESKDNPLRYVDMVKVFQDRANAIDFQCKTSLRACERLAKHLASEKPKTPKEFERHEYLKDFVLKSSKAHETMVELLEYTRNFLQEVVTDSKDLQSIAKLRDVVKFDQQTIAIVTQQRNDLADELAAYKRNSK